MTWHRTAKRYLADRAAAAVWWRGSVRDVGLSLVSVTASARPGSQRYAHSP